MHALLQTSLEVGNFPDNRFKVAALLHRPLLVIFQSLQISYFLKIDAVLSDSLVFHEFTEKPQR